MVDEHIEVNGIFYRIIELLGHGKGGYSYLAESENEKVVIKQIHHEPCDYYTFGNKIEAELNDYQRLLKAGIRMPVMKACDKDRELIIKEYIEGKTAEQMISDGESVEAYIEQIIDMAEKARAAGLNIDYYPTNFVVSGELLYYIDYECNEYMEQWNLENWGMKHWRQK